MYQDKLNPKDLPTLQEVQVVVDQLRALIRPLTWGAVQPHQELDALPAIFMVWNNSTRVNEVREIAFTIRYPKTQAVVDATIGKHEQFTKVLPTKAVHVYTYNFRDQPAKAKVKGNCLKLFYRSSK